MLSSPCFTSAVTVPTLCILPMLPILLGASVEQTGRVRPVFIVLSFVLAFSGGGREGLREPGHSREAAGVRGHC
jgi:hypothetical protein